MLADLPDLWDFQLGHWEDDSVTARFADEGHQEEYVTGLMRLTSKPVVGVGRFTSPDTMVRLIRSGVLDLIGAARPSIADPFLPKKIEEGRLDDLRECIGCNVCVAGDWTMSPIRCTQNPAMGEEWRRGWHPERHRPKRNDAKVLVVGAGPAGLEASHALGKRGYDVVLVEATRTLGGRVATEARLPGLATWIRVLDYRFGQIRKLGNVEYYLESAMTADDALGYGFDHVCVATGATWRSDGVGRHHTRPIPVADGAMVLTPDDVMAGGRPQGERVVVFDDDHYYMGGVLAELLATDGYRVLLVTPAPIVSSWTVNTMEQRRIHRRLVDQGVEIRCNEAVVRVLPGGVETECEYTGRRLDIACDAVVPVTARLPNTSLIDELRARRSEWETAGVLSVRSIGDCLSPGTIASAVWWGRRYSETLDQPEHSERYRRDLPALDHR